MKKQIKKVIATGVMKPPVDKKEIKQMPKYTRDDSMTKHIIAPDVYAPPYLPDLENAMVQQQTFCANLFRQRSDTYDLSTNPKMATVFSPIVNFDSVHVPVDTNGQVITWPTPLTWSANPYKNGITGSYTHIKYLGFKITATVTTNALNRGGTHGFYILRPNVIPASAYPNGLLHATNTIDATLTAMSPLTELHPVTQDISALWIGTDENLYNWTRTNKLTGNRDVTDLPGIAYPDAAGDPWTGAGTILPIPLICYYINGVEQQSVTFTIHQYVELMQLPGMLPPAIEEFERNLAVYVKNSGSKTAQPAIAMPDFGNLKVNARNPKVVSKDFKWYDKVAYALTGKNFTGTMKDLGSSLLKSLPKLIATFL